MLEAQRTGIRYYSTSSGALANCGGPDRSGCGARNGRLAWHKSWLKHEPHAFGVTSHTHRTTPGSRRPARLIRTVEKARLHVTNSGRR